MADTLEPFTSMKYSFVLPAYKGRYLSESINSILSQTYSSFELIIVDDCSPDNLDKVVSEFSDSKIKYYRNGANIGGKNLVQQWNNSIQYASGEYIILASDDDIYHNDYLEKIDQIIQQYPGLNVYRCRISHIDGKGKHLDDETPYRASYLSRDEYLKAYAHDIISSGIPQFTFRSSALKSIGGFVNFPLAWFSDDATVAALSQTGIGLCNDILFDFRKSDINISNGVKSIEATKKKIIAAAEYYKYMGDILSTDSETLEAVANRARRQSFYVLKDSSFKNLMVGVKTIVNIKSNLYTLPWITHTFFSFFKRKLIK